MDHVKAAYGASSNRKSFAVVSGRPSACKKQYGTCAKQLMKTPTARILRTTVLFSAKSWPSQNSVICPANRNRTKLIGANARKRYLIDLAYRISRSFFRSAPRALQAGKTVAVKLAGIIQSFVTTSNGAVDGLLKPLIFLTNC